jgi:hypothetical protein
MVGVNTKGILKTNADKTIDRPKMAYYAAQHVFSLFDYQVALQKEQPKTNQSTMYAFQYKQEKNGGTIVSLWSGEARPADTYEAKPTNITINNASFTQPVYADMISGKVFEIPKSNFTKTGATWVFTDIPVTDYPVLIADKKALWLKN